ncbi:sugar phosphate isomerase/epimerase [Kiritimatiellaeota bacterium B1221]|nr:sugar phosphate isomerase/epimerase [Kiritimatiellaeota bacterium B1221]
MQHKPFSQLSGLLEIGCHPTRERIESECKRLRDAGFTDAYLGDIFLEYVPSPLTPDPDRLVFSEEEGALCFRSDDSYKLVKEVLKEQEIGLQSAHYNQLLPPPGTYPSDWLMRYHDQMLAIAARLGLQRVTTHTGWMFGSAMERYVGDAARAFREKEISITQLNRAAFESYGGDSKIWNHCVELYRELCSRAAQYGITITIETAISEWYDLTLHPERMVQFCKEVGAPNIGICVDSGHCHLNGLHTASVIRSCGSFMCETHFHDNYGQRDEHNPVGVGTVDWNGIIQALHDIQYQGLITFEQRDHQTNGARWHDYLTAHFS